MARRMGARRAFLPRSPARLTEWFGSADITAMTALPAASFVFDQSLTTAEKAKRPFTITRVVGVVFAQSDQVGAQEDPFGAVGFMVVSEKASTLGATALPDPITEESSDEWFAYQYWGTNGGPIAGQPMAAFPFDSRGQRKVGDGEDVVIMVANANAAHGAQFRVKFRMLVKLS